MSKKIKVWLIIATSLIILGAIVFTTALITAKGDFMKFSTSKFQNKDYQITENFNSISITDDITQIEILPSNDSNCLVKCYEHVNKYHLVSVKDQTLVIELKDVRKWYEYISINFHTPTLTIYLPQSEYDTLCVKNSTGNVKVQNAFTFNTVDISLSTGKIGCYANATQSLNIKTTTGSINIEEISAGSINLSVSTGKITAKNIDCVGNFEIKVSTGETFLKIVNCANLISSGSTGDIELEKVIANDKFSIRRSTGDVEFNDCDAGEIFIETSTGDVEGSLLSNKIFFVDTNTGRKDVPKTLTGGKCEITTDTGDIKITIE